MKLVDRVFAALGYVSTSAARRQARAFAAAATGRLAAGWSTTTSHINQELFSSLPQMRARSRQLCRDQEYAKQFLRMLKTNVVGHAGMSMQVKALRQDGTLDEVDSNRLEEHFATWGKPGNCDVTGKLSWRDVQRLFCETLARDGEVLIRECRGRAFGPYRYQLQMLDPALIDVTLNRDLADGSKIRMGVELDSFMRPLAVHLLPSSAMDVYSMGYSVTQRHLRVPAGEIFHLFLIENTDQIRGIPWMHAAMVRMNSLEGYEEAAITAARVGAAQCGFFESPEGDASPLADGTDADTGELMLDADPGSFKTLPPGYKLANWSPEYPHAMYAPFVKAALRGISAGLGVSYNGLANDLEGVNFSSMRVGTLEEREVWKALQSWMIEHFCAPVYSHWLVEALATGLLDPMPISKLAKFDAALFQGRRWAWVDPLKDVEARVVELDNGLTSRRRILLEQGLDPEEVWQELQAEKERLKDVLPDPATQPMPARSRARELLRSDEP